MLSQESDYRASINDVTQEGGEGIQLCDTKYKVVSKTVILM